MSNPRPKPRAAPNSTGYRPEAHTRLDYLTGSRNFCNPGFQKRLLIREFRRTEDPNCRSQYYAGNSSIP